MAYTKIFAVRDSLSRIVGYAANPDKTTLEDTDALKGAVDYALNPVKAVTETRLFESAINCASPGCAYAEMKETKKRFGKPGGVLGYHVIQSFLPGEVTPEQAHAIGVEFARRCFGDRFEAVIGTHLDKGHLHSHIVINSVSCTDGYKYRSNKGSYYKDIRGISDALCRENGLSVIDPEGRGKHYKQWYDEKMGKPSGATLIKADIDEAIKASFTFTAFIEQMKKRGYGVKCGPNVMHMAVKPHGGKKHFRLDTFKDPWYTEAGIRERILAASEGREPNIAPRETPLTSTPPTAPPATYTPMHYKLPRSRPWRKPRKLKGFVALYWRYCYLLRETMHRKLPNRAAFLLRDELKKFDSYQSQFLLLYRNKIESIEDLASYRREKEDSLAAGIDRRKALYTERKTANEEGQAEISAEIGKINESLRGIRRAIRLCERIAQDAARLQSACEQVDAETAKYQDMSHGKDRKNNERRKKGD